MLKELKASCNATASLYVNMSSHTDYAATLRPKSNNIHHLSELYSNQNTQLKLGQPLVALNGSEICGVY